MTSCKKISLPIWVIESHAYLMHIFHLLFQIHGCCFWFNQLSQVFFTGHPFYCSIGMTLTQFYADIFGIVCVVCQYSIFFVLYFCKTSLLWRNLDLIEYCYYILYESHFFTFEPDLFVDYSSLVVIPTFYVVEISILLLINFALSPLLMANCLTIYHPREVPYGCSPFHEVGIA